MGIVAIERDKQGKPQRAILGMDLADELAWQLRAAKLPKPEREFRFHAKRRWRFDLAFPDRLLAIEVNGAEFSGGRHNRGLGMAKDFEKLNTATIAGWMCLQFTGSQVRSGYALNILEQLFQAGSAQEKGER